MALQTPERGFDELYLLRSLPAQRLLGIVLLSDIAIKDALNQTIALNGGQ